MHGTKKLYFSGLADIVFFKIVKRFFDRQFYSSAECLRVVCFFSDHQKEKSIASVHAKAVTK